MNKLIWSVTASLALLASAPLMAQESQQSPETANTTGGYSDPASAGSGDTFFNDQELKQFVAAQEGISEVRDEYQEKIQAAGSREKAQKLQMEANDEMVTVIEDSGIDVQTYNAIATAYNSEPQVRNRVDALM
jgi:hypothetical protein